MLFRSNEVSLMFIRCFSKKESVRDVGVTGREVGAGWMTGGHHRSAGGAFLEAVFELLPDLWPFVVNDAEAHRIALATIGPRRGPGRRRRGIAAGAG